MANSDTTITYNGVTLRNVLTDYIDQQVVADSTGMNPLYVKVTVSCTGIIHETSAGDPLTIGLSSRTYGGDLADGYNNFIDNLMQPGRDFLMLVGTKYLFDVTPAWRRPGLPIPPETPIRKRDVNHGPLPEVRVLGITSAHTMKVQFRITMHLPYTDADGQVPGGAISFRFWISEDISGQNWLTERTYHGVFRVRHMGHNVLTEIRNNFAMPVLVDGFIRKRIGLHQRPNGLELEFTITDQEVWAVPPSPSTHWSGHQTLFTPQQGGFLLASQVSVTLESDNKTPKHDLLKLGQKIIDTKLHRLDNVHQQGTILRHFNCRDTFQANKIEMTAEIQLVGKERHLWNLERGNFGLPMNYSNLGSDSQLPEYLKDRMRIVFPTACIKGLFLAALQDPAHVQGFPKTNETATQLFYERGACPEIVNQPSSTDDWQANVSQEQLASAYTVWAMNVITSNLFGVIQLPFGKSSQTQGTGSGDTAVLLSMHKPTANMRVRVEAERLMKWPTLPSAEEYQKLGTTFAPMAGRVIPSAPILSADGAKTLYHCCCDYNFAQAAIAAAIPAGLAPYRLKNSPGAFGQQANVFVVPSEAFSNKILFE